MKKILLVIALLIVVCVIFIPYYAFKIEPTFVKVNQLSFEKGTQENTVKVVQISDIQLSEAYATDKLPKIIEKVNAEQADIIVFTGDLLDNYAKYGPTEELSQALSQMEATIGKYGVWGNHDYGGGASRIYESTMNQGGFTILRNEGVTLTMASGGELFIGGMDDSLLGNPSSEEVLMYRQAPDYSIVLSHEPDVADEFLQTDTQLILAGHSHGGQINLPLIKGPMPPYAQKYQKGLYQLDEETTLYVNSGLGTTQIHARLMAPPEVTSFTIKF